MSYLIATNVVSEVARSRPSPRVMGWLRSVPDAALHMSVLSLGEIRKGVESLTDGPRKERLRVWLEQEVPGWFEDRLLAVDAHVADRWGRLMAGVRSPAPAIDGLLAATALHHGLRIVTRNVADFRRFVGLEVIDPWA